MIVRRPGADDIAREREGCLSREATTTLGGRRAMMMSMMSMMTMISAPRDARAETKEASHALEKLTRGYRIRGGGRGGGARARRSVPRPEGGLRRRPSREREHDQRASPCVYATGVKAAEISKKRVAFGAGRGNSSIETEQAIEIMMETRRFIRGGGHGRG